MEKFVIRFLNSEGNPVTETTVNELVQNIRGNCCSFIQPKFYRGKK